MRTKVANIASKVWHDPVWSKVIAGVMLPVILGIGALSWGYVKYVYAPRPTPHEPISEEELGLRNLVVPHCDSSRDPRRSYEIVRDLPTQEARESAISDLAGDAICAKDEQFALELFAKLTSLRGKDAAARQIIAVYFSRKEYAKAKGWTAFLSDPRDREWWLKRILSSIAAPPSPNPPPAKLDEAKGPQNFPEPLQSKIAPPVSVTPALSTNLVLLSVRGDPITLSRQALAGLSEGLTASGFRVKSAEMSLSSQDLRTNALGIGAGTMLECEFRIERYGISEIGGEKVRSSSARITCSAQLTNTGATVLTSSGADSAAHVTENEADLAALQSAIEQVSRTIKTELRRHLAKGR